MSSKLDKPQHAIGIDVGTSHIVVASIEDSEYRFRSELNAFVSIRYSRMTEVALRREQIPYSRVNGELLVHGNAAERFATMLGLETRRPMRAGVLNPSEPANIDAIGRILDTMLTGVEPGSTLVCYSVPGPPVEGEGTVAFHQAALGNLLTERGFRCTSVDEGLAVIYGELEDTNYSGIGISCGGGLCNVALAFLAVPLASFSIPKAGDYIDASAAASLGEQPWVIRIEKEQRFSLNGQPQDQRHYAISVYYDEVIRELIHTMCEVFGRLRATRKIEQPVPIVLSGGTAQPRGFRERFERALRAVRFPLAISEVRMAREPLYSTARGALRAALSEIEEQ